MALRLFRCLVIVLLGASTLSCATAGQLPSAELEDPRPYLDETILTKAIVDLGALLRAYPSRRPYEPGKAIVIEIKRIPDQSGGEGLPPNLSTELEHILQKVGSPIRVLPFRDLIEREEDLYDAYSRPVVKPTLSIRGAVTEGEKIASVEKGIQGDGQSGKWDGGGSMEEGEELRALKLVLHLVNDGADGLIANSVSCRIKVRREGDSSSFGFFFDGSGIGFRANRVAAQSKSRALQLAAQYSVLVLVGRHFRLPYWRVLPNAEPDLELVNEYQDLISTGSSPDELRALLMVHGIDVDLLSYRFSGSEEKVFAALRQHLGLPEDVSYVDLTTRLWESVPYGQTSSPLNGLRRELEQVREEYVARQEESDLEYVRRRLSALKVGEELVLPVFFESGDSSLSATGKERVDLLVMALEGSALFDKAWWLELRGHTDERGDARRNLNISGARANSVKRYLQSKHSFPEERVVSRGFGSTKPAKEKASSEEEHQANRRVEIVVVAGDASELPHGLPEGSTGEKKPVPQDLFPPESWPLPQGVSLPSALADSTYLMIRKAYPHGRRSNTFGFYSVRLSPAESEVFAEVTFFFKEKAFDSRVGWVGLSCRRGGEDVVRASIEDRLSTNQKVHASQDSTTWVDSLGYEITVGLDNFCLVIKPSVGA